MRAFFQRHAVLHIWLLCALLTAAAFHLSKGNRMLMNALAEHVTGPVKETLGALCAALRTEKGAEVLTLEVRDSNEAAIRLYAALGFTEIGRRPNYYFHPKEDARILRKDLTA